VGIFRNSKGFATRRRTTAATLLAVAGLLAAAHPVWAQASTPPAASPAAPGDLSRPQFDTTTPAYDVARSREKSSTTIVAEVDGRAITLGDVGDAIRELPATVSALPFETLFPSVLDRLVKQQALVIHAQQRGIDEQPATKRKVKAAAERALVSAYLHDEIHAGITERMLLDRYKSEYAGKPGPEEVHARVIMTATEREAADLITEIKGGADFAAVARRSSKDSTAPAGGDLGFMPRDRFNPEVAAVVFAMSPGQLTAYPVRSTGGWFVLKTEERRQTVAPAFPFVREQIQQALLRENLPKLTADALSGVVVREYSVSGKQTDDASQGGR
jgi:peptidyl-prolyl cis-trans isomerase C